MAKQKIIWCCKECGNEQPKWSGSCPACHEWNTMVEEKAVESETRRFEAKPEKGAEPMKISDIPHEDFNRIITKFTEFDRLMGGGVVPGSLTLIGGDPGIGKSTLLLQISHHLAEQGLVVLYICGEESAQQTSLRARRLGVSSSTLFLLSETLFSEIQRQIDRLRPDVLIVDSIQILYKHDLPSSPGSVVQVRELATEFMHLSKGRGISTFLIGHITKSGEIAGPKVLEHLVDTVLDFEGDRQHGYRLLRAIKNRFGPTDEIALLQMNHNGLSEVANPSQIFLEERLVGLSGSCIIPTIEGSRPFLIEIQALVGPSVYPSSTRRSTGLDPNRLALLLAVLEKRGRLDLCRSDVFVSIAGGLKINEPATDLGVLLAIASSFCNKPLDSKITVVGEVGLGGEIRSVPRIDQRIKEAIQMGFERMILPKKNLRGVSAELLKKIELCGVEVIDDALAIAIG